jgi:hypothetical protein
MPRFLSRVVVIIPAGKRRAVNDALEALGWGPDNFSVPLHPVNASSNAPATHYACEIGLTSKMKMDLDRILKPASATVHYADLVLYGSEFFQKVLAKEGLKRKQSVQAAAPL